MDSSTHHDWVIYWGKIWVSVKIGTPKCSQVKDKLGMFSHPIQVSFSVPCMFSISDTLIYAYLSSVQNPVWSLSYSLIGIPLVDRDIPHYIGELFSQAICQAICSSKVSIFPWNHQHLSTNRGQLGKTEHCNGPRHSGRWHWRASQRHGRGWREV